MENSRNDRMIGPYCLVNMNLSQQCLQFGADVAEVDSGGALACHLHFNTPSLKSKCLQVLEAMHLKYLEGRKVKLSIVEIPSNDS